MLIIRKTRKGELSMNITPLNIDELSVEQKIGQLIVVRNTRSDEEREYLCEMLAKKCVGGIQMNPDGTHDEEIAEYKRIAGYPVLICADMEKGFPGNPEYQIPSAMALSTTADEELAYQFAAVTAIEAKRHGFTTIWSPVVDLLAGNSMIRVPRVFGSDPDYVSRMTAAMLRGFSDNGILTSAKHYPAPIDDFHDGHVFNKQSVMTEEDIFNTCLKPYLYHMEKGILRGIMSDFTTYPKVDPDYPAALSEKIVGYVRSRGYDGLMFTDSFAMVGILQKYGEKDGYGRAIKVGNDMVLPNYRVPFKTSYEYLLDAYKNGAFSEERLNDAVRRVINAQNFTLKAASAEYPSEYQKKCFERISKDSICVYKDKNTQTALGKDTKKLFVLMTYNTYVNDAGVPLEISDTTGIADSDVPQLRNVILEKFKDSKVLTMNQFPNSGQIQQICSTAVNVDEVIFLTFNSTGAYKLTPSLCENVFYLMNSMADKISAIVHLGNPYVAETFPKVERVLLSVGGKAPTYMRALEVLGGEYEPHGVLPIELNVSSKPLL